MRKAKRTLSRLAAVVVAGASLAAVTAAPAMADSGYAQWSSGYPINVSGSMTFERGDGAVAPVTCNVEETWTAAKRAWNWRCPDRVIGSYSIIPIWTQAPGDELLGIPPGDPVFYLLGQQNNPFEENPWNDRKWAAGGLLPTFQNGNAVEPSHITFSKQQLGWAYTSVGGPTANVYATGTVNFTNSTGGLTTLIK